MNLFLKLLATLLANRIFFSDVAVVGLRAKSPYLYAGNAHPVIEYMALSEKPSFLYDSDNEHGFRLVQFYDKLQVPSQQIRESFIGTAASTVEQAQLNNATLDVYTISCTALPALCDIEAIFESTLPVFRLYPPSSSDGVPVTSLEVLDVLEIMKLQYIEPPAKASRWAISRGKDGDKENQYRRSLDDLRADVHLAFDTMMRTVYEEDKLTNDQRDLLKNWLLLLHKTVPPSWSIHREIKQLINSFAYVVKNRAYMAAILDNNKPPTKSLSAACRSNTHSTCGVWELFHTVSVGVVEYNKLVDGATHKLIAITEAARIMRDYVALFGVGNDATKTFFVQTHDECAKEKCLPSSNDFSDWIQFPLWLSETHTEVNLQLLRTESKLNLQEEVKAQWPPRKYCPACWTSTPGNQRWNTEVVYKYLQLEYTQVEDLPLETRQEIFGTPLPHATSHLFHREDNSISLRSARAILLVVGLALACVRIASFKKSRKHAMGEDLPIIAPRSAAPPNRGSIRRRHSSMDHESPIKRRHSSRGTSSGSPIKRTHSSRDHGSPIKRSLW